MAEGEDGGDIGAGAGRGIGVLAVRALNSIATILMSAFPNTTGGTSSSATAGAATLPANPVEFLVITMPDGTIRKIPMYDE